MIAAIAQTSIMGSEIPVKASPPVPPVVAMVPPPPPGLDPWPPDVEVTFRTTEPEAEADVSVTVYEPFEPVGAVSEKLAAPADVEVKVSGTVQPSDTEFVWIPVVELPVETETVTCSLGPK